MYCGHLCQNSGAYSLCGLIYGSPIVLLINVCFYTSTTVFLLLQIIHLCAHMYKESILIVFKICLFFITKFSFHLFLGQETLYYWCLISSSMGLLFYVFKSHHPWNQSLFYTMVSKQYHTTKIKLYHIESQIVHSAKK